MTEPSVPRVPRHSARRAGIKQRRVSQPFFDALVTLEQRATTAETLLAAANARVAELIELGGALAGRAEDIDDGGITRQYDELRSAYKAWNAATPPAKPAVSE